jgi:predicted ATPase/DNA-binding SARP family transcriptional activator/Tfp pilus assembly protein PilF
MDHNGKESLQIRLLGGMDVTVGGSPLPPLRSRSAGWLLALLTLRHGQEAQRSWLAGLLWPDTDESVALGNLRRTLTDLRKAMGYEGSRILAPSPRSLLLDVSGASVDVVTFDEGIRRANAESLAAAVLIYRGPLLPGCLEEWVLQERETREEAFLGALEALARHAMEADNPHEAARHLRRAVAMAPWRETACRGLMEALSSAGDHAAVTLAYRDLRTALRNELNTDPGPETQELFRRLRSEAQARAVVKARPTQPPEPFHDAPTPASTSGRMPRPLTPLIGRERELEEITSALRGARLMTLTGAGGVGKTRLAVQAAHEQRGEYPDGVWFVDLTPLSDPAAIPTAIETVLGLRESSDGDVMKTLAGHLEGHHLLIVLDNCEHLLGECGRVAVTLLEGAPNLTILTTSRQPLGLPGEVVWRVPALGVPQPLDLTGADEALLRRAEHSDAVRLFVERTTAASRDFRLDEANVRAVTLICRSLDGIPLAIELAAARVTSMTVAEIAGRLDDRFRMLRGAGTLSHKQTLLGLMDWSHDLLTAAERALLRRSAVFAGGWTLDAAEAVCADDYQSDTLGDEGQLEAGDVQETLSSLVDKSLVNREEAGGRYRLLETVRQYAWMKLEEAGETDEVRERHCRFYGSLAQQAEPHFVGPDQKLWMERLDAEIDNLRLAIEWTIDPETHLGVCASLVRFWQSRGHLAEARARLEGALKRPDSDRATAARACALNAVGTVAMEQNDFAASRRFLEECLQINRGLGQPSKIGSTLNNLGNLNQREGKLSEARTLYEEAVSAMREAGRTDAVGVILNNLGIVASHQNDIGASRRFYEQALQVNREIGNRGEEAGNLCNLGMLALREGDVLGARDLLDRALSLNREVGNKLWQTLILNHLAHASCLQSDWSTAISSCREAAEIAGRVDRMQTLSESLELLAAVATLRGMFACAARLFGTADSVRQGLGRARTFMEADIIDAQKSVTRSELGEIRFAAECSTGRSMSWQESSDMAIAEMEVTHTVPSGQSTRG